MGRGKGDPARSKFRASSSSLAASLLQTPATSGVGFGGFVGSARVDCVPSIDGEIPLDVEGDVALHLKRLPKKDPTTKLKALTALATLFEERSASELAAILPHWVFEYKRLVQDCSRQVRQNTHLAMTSLASSVGRGLAPHLRSLMGPWWVSQFDPSREVLEAAQTSFQVAFSGQKKRLEALVYCENEIFSHLDDNLKLTPQTISDKATPIEESTEKHERVITCSLLALAALIDVLVGPVSSSSGQENAANNVNGEVNAKTRALVTEAATKLCWNHNFLRQYVKSKSSRIRSSSYQALRAFIQYLPQVFRDEDMVVVGPSVLGTFSEKDPACHQPMWDMILLFAKGFPQSWGAAGINKSMFSQLWGFLRSGCHGSQQISYPYLLPFISLIPPSAIVPSQNFLLEFFKSLWKGLDTPQVGAKDRAALMKALQECLVWTVLNAKRFSDAESNEAIKLQAALINGILLKLIWHDFVTSTGDCNLLTNISEPTFSKVGSGVNVPGISSEHITQELAACVVKIIQTLSLHDDEIMFSFWVEFQSSCVQLVQDAGNLWKSVKEDDGRVARITEFYKVLGSKTLKGGKREQWPLTHAVRPFVAKSFPTIRSLGHPGSITLIAKLISIYGPTCFSELGVSSALERIKDPNCQDLQGQDLKADEDVLKFFKEELVPWCLNGKGDLNGPKSELVLAFIESDGFQGEWNVVLTHLTGWQNSKEDGVDTEQVGVLATLLDKVRETMHCQPVNDEKIQEETLCDIIRWKSPRIDGAALAVASSDFLAHPVCLQLLRSTLGGTSSEQVVVPIVSENTALQILEKLLLRLLIVLSRSPLNWIRSAPLVITDLQLNDSISLSDHQEATEECLQLAVSAINVLENCIFLLPTLQNSHTVGVKLVAAMFCLNWAHSSADVRAAAAGYDSADEYDTDLESEEEIDANDSPLEPAPELRISRDIYNSGIVEDEPPSKLEQDWGSLRDAVVSIRHRISPSFCRRFTALARFRLREVLIKYLRLTVLDKEFQSSGQTVGRCAAWAHEVVAYTCEGPDEVSEFVECLLAPLDCWPQWVSIPSVAQKYMHSNIPTWKNSELLSDAEVQSHQQVAAFVDNLCRQLSPQEVFFGSTTLLDRKIASEGTSVAKLERGQESCRIWLVIELLCTWEWPGGTALRHVLPFLWSFARSNRDSSSYNLLWGTIEALFLGDKNFRAKSIHASTSIPCEDDVTFTKGPFLQALLVLLKGLLEKEDGWSKVDARHLFRQYVTKPEAVDFVSPFCDVQILPDVLAILMPTIRKRVADSTEDSSGEEWESFIQTAVSVWLQKAIMKPPLVAIDEISGDQWIQVAVSCFPLNPAGGTAAIASASTAPVTCQEIELLLSLLRKQFSREAVAAVAALAAVDRNSQDQARSQMKSGRFFEVTLAKLIAAAIGYCWLDFGKEDWEFIMRRLRGWLQEAVIEVEEFAEAIVDVMKDSQENTEPRDVVTKLEDVVSEKGKHSQLSSIAVAIFSLLKGLSNLEGVDSADAMTSMKATDWDVLEMRAMEDILRMLLSIGLAESTGKRTGKRGGEVIAIRRKLDNQLWDNVADVALSSSSQAREAAIRAVDLWGLGNGAISSLYALLFSTQPTISLQWVAYQFLTTGQILQMAVTCGVVPEETKSKVEDETIDDGETKVEEVKQDDTQQPPAFLIAHIRPELASILETSQSLIVESPLTDSLRVSFLLGWSVLLTRLQSLSAMSSTRKRLVQYIQDSDISPTLLDCLFQHIPLDQKLGTSGSRKKTLAAGVKTSSAAAPAKRAAATGSIAFAVEGLWPVQREGLVTLTGALYGLMLLVLPACVRIWFTGLRDKSLALAIEAFTTSHCSPQLLADEFFQVQAAAVDEENLSIRANRSLREVTAIYKKEEAGMDIVIRIPPCYPLRAVDVECTRRMGINETLLRKWILSMAAFLRNQNGAVAEAVQLWKKNVDREFDGVEECPICYSIIHTSNHSLPRLACKTCRHKFHSACLYKWFSTSHQSTCPLCKTPF